jgi:hypothetical protein
LPLRLINAYATQLGGFPSEFFFVICIATEFYFVNRNTAKHFSFFASLLGLLLISGCSHTPITLTFAEAAGMSKRNAVVDTLQLNPQLRYLRVTIKEKPLLMVLGYEEATPQGTLETWYSNQGEVLQLLNGRVRSTAGLAIDWKNIRYQALPTWAGLVGSTSKEFVRVHEQMPRYAFDVSEQVQIYSVPAPTNANLTGMPASQLKWFEEKVKGTSQALPSARFGLAMNNGKPVVVYGEQCFATDLCFSWQTWPVAAKTN